VTTAETDAGRKLVVRVAVIAIAVSIITIVSFNLVQGTGRLPQQLVRFGLTLALCYFLIRGQSWARWVSAALFLIAGLGSLVGSVGMLGQSLGAFVFLALALAYLYCAGVLLASSVVRAFFGASRGALPTPGSGA
jgi:hypothetical protein